MMAASSRRSNGPRSRCSTVRSTRDVHASRRHLRSVLVARSADRSRMRSTKMPGVTTVSGSIAPTSTTRDDLGDGQRRGGRHHRPEVAGSLAVQQVSRSVADVGADQSDVARGSGTPARSRGRRWCGSPCLRPAACRRRSGRRTRRCPRRPPGSARPGFPAAPPRVRPCRRGTARRTHTNPPAAETSR